jgi:uncharacterized membrane protein YphA (DoxX/SURF4 family)
MRIVIGLLFLQHGSQKLFGIPGSGQQGANFSLLSLMGVAGMLELFGGLLILVGLFTRPVAFILSGQMAVAYFMAHAPSGLVGAAELALQLLGGNAVARRAEAVHGVVPALQAGVGLLEGSANHWVHVVAAPLAAVGHLRSQLVKPGDLVALWTQYLLAEAGAEQMIQASFVVRKELEKLL